ncbi:hypothetical protein B0H65DRAFT_466505 [Neurospora tetraspora]|uniref:Secreted protein n=1 Tax=Neurospora tetraspora TaxID=94610 RepID=A0AAE0JG78_9PEZI|nr:hypothetical protein B0H65DRAFT_466505 [Neurospora tetraspora]
MPFPCLLLACLISNSLNTVGSVTLNANKIPFCAVRWYSKSHPFIHWQNPRDHLTPNIQNQGSSPIMPSFSFLSPIRVRRYSIRGLAGAQMQLCRQSAEAVRHCRGSLGVASLAAGTLSCPTSGSLGEEMWNVVGN